MMTPFTLQFVLTELYNKICTCLRDDPEKEDLLNPKFHAEGCLYKIAVEKEKNIEWKETNEQNETTNES